MEPIQAFINGMNQQWQRERAESQMTLGKMIEALEAMPHDAKVAAISHAHSYRGYYSDLAFEPEGSGLTRSVASLLAECRSSMGAVYEGYKGGEFQIGRNTPVWIASYGCCGVKLMGFNADGTLATKEDD